MKFILTTVFVLALASCAGKGELYDPFYNIDPSLFGFEVTEVGNKVLVTITNNGNKPLRYVAPLALRDCPTYYVEMYENGKKGIFVFNTAELKHDYTLEPGESLAFTFSHQNNILRMGFPYFDQAWKEDIVWFYSNTNI
ncbi:MAG: hypothetical protein HWE27_12860 [Gammaproteobacteria bacterium]|nr:hypothetical protein [Gammaproteobacteria bacterium]